MVFWKCPGSKTSYQRKWSPQIIKYFTLSGDEPTEEFGDNLKTVEIPGDMQKKFHEDDEKELKLAEEEKLERLQKSDTKWLWHSSLLEFVKPHVGD